jgi:hypothetical protein
MNKDYISEKDSYEINFHTLTNKTIILNHPEDNEEFHPDLSTIYYRNDGGLLRFFGDCDDLMEKIFNESKKFKMDFKVFEGESNDDEDLKEKIVFDADCGGSWVEIYGIDRKDALMFVKLIYGPLIKLEGWEVN